MLSNMSGQEKEQIIIKVGHIDETATPLKQARYINNFLCAAEEMGVKTKNCMRKCGSDCISNNAIKIAKKLYSKSANISEFLEKLNEADIGGRNLHLDNGHIIGIYKKCYCNIPKKVDVINQNYCECSAGWFEALFSTVFDKKVKVTIIDTITNGAPECTFRIAY